MAGKCKAAAVGPGYNAGNEVKNMFRLILIGAGQRGMIYARYAYQCGLADFAALAEPDEERRQAAAEALFVSPKNSYASAEALSTWPIFWMPLREADKVIGIPAVKDHNLCHASAGLKNWYGLLGGRRNQFHQAIHHIISDLGYMMKPTLMVMDGTRVMMKNGPTGGRLDDIRVGGVTGRPAVVASVDQLACDSWCVQNLLGRDLAAVSYLDLAFQKFGHDPTRLVVHHWQEYRQQGKVVEETIEG